MGVKHVLKELVRSLQLSWQRRRFLHFGEGSYVSPFGMYLPSCKIHVGNSVYIGPRAIVSATEGVYIGDGVTIGPEFMVMGGDHNFRLVGKRIWEVKTGGVNEPVSIEDDVWIGGRVVVLKGVTLGRALLWVPVPWLREMLNLIRSVPGIRRARSRRGFQVKNSGSIWIW